MEEKLPKAPHLFVLMLISFVMVFVIVFITPALPQLSEYFGKSKNSTKQVVTWFLAGFPVGVLIYAPFSNRFGRKATLYLGFSTALVGSIICLIPYFYKSFVIMNIGRFIQGLGAIAGFQVAMTLVGDCFRGSKARVTSAYMMLSVGLSSGVGIAIGAVLTSFGWVYCYIFLVWYFVFLLLLTKYFVSETLQKPIPFKMKDTCQGYIEHVKIPEIVLSGLLLGSALAITYIFPSTSSFIVLQRLSYSENIFALWNIFPPLGIAAGNLLSVYFVRWVSPLFKLYIGVICLSLSALLYLLFFGYNVITLSSVFLPYVLSLLGLGFINSNAVAFTVMFSKNKAKGSSIFGFFSYTTSLIFMIILSFLKATSILLMPMFFLAVSALSWVYLIVLQILKKNRANTS